MNFVDPKEIDIPRHGTKNRYKTILPSKFLSFLFFLTEVGLQVGWMGSLGLVDANYDIWNGWAMKCYCIAQGTVSGLLG